MDWKSLLNFLFATGFVDNFKAFNKQTWKDNNSYILKWRDCRKKKCVPFILYSVTIVPKKEVIFNPVYIATIFFYVIILLIKNIFWKYEYL